MNSNKIESLDTNTILRFILGDNKSQQEKVLSLLLRPDISYYIDDLVFFEIIYILTSDNYGFSRDIIANFVEMIFKRLDIVGDYALISEATHFYVAHPKLSWADCYLSVKTTHLNHTPLWTFDKKLAGQSKNAKLIS